MLIRATSRQTHYLQRLSVGLVLLMSVLAMTASRLGAEVETWTDEKGRTMQAEFIKMDGRDVVFRKDGKEVRYPLNQLSSADKAKALQRSLEGNSANPFESVDSGNSSSGNSSSSLSPRTSSGSSGAGSGGGSASSSSSKAATRKELERRRTWTDNKGETAQAKYVRMHEGQVVLNRSGRITKIPFHDLSEGDIQYLTDMLTKLGEESKIPPKPVRNPNGAGSGGYGPTGGYDPSGGSGGYDPTGSGGGGSFPGIPGLPSFPGSGRSNPGGSFPGGSSNGGYPGMDPSNAYDPEGGSGGMEEYGGYDPSGGSDMGSGYGSGSGSGVPGSSFPGSSFPGSGGGSSSSGMGTSEYGSSPYGAVGGYDPSGGADDMGDMGMGSSGMGGSGMGGSGIGGGMGGIGGSSFPTIPKMVQMGECSDCGAEFAETEIKGKTHCPKCGIAWINRGGKAGTRHDNQTKDNRIRFTGIGSIIAAVIAIISVIARIASR